MATSIPFSVRPLQPSLVWPFHRDGWVYEAKIDGWRIVAYKSGRQVRLVSRNGVDHTARFRDLAAAVAALPDATLILDGEVAVFDERLISRFDLLSEPDPAVVATPPVYVAFDVLYARGQDLRARPLAARREMLEEIVDGAGSVFVVPRLSANGHEAWAEVQRRGLEGFVAKDPASLYRTGGSTRSWLKAKVRHEAHFLVGGVVERSEGWSLLLRQRGAAAPTVSRTGPLGRGSAAG
jgi:bifunctional non-homologous end joining protein LigD